MRKIILSLEKGIANRTQKRRHLKNDQKRKLLLRTITTFNIQTWPFPRQAKEEEDEAKENRVEEKGKPRKEKSRKGNLVKGDKYITIYIYMNNNKYINPSCKLLKEMTKLSKSELHVLSKNYKKFIDNIKTKDKIKQVKIEKDRYDY